MATAQLQRRSFTPEEYLALERAADFKSEYLEGEIYAMAGISPQHSAITVNFSGEVRAQLKGTPCQAFSSYKKSLWPYTRQTEKIFHCPADKSGAVSYSFNGYLQGVSLTQIKQPAKTVMIYEGTNQRLAFRHDGRAVVGFADGHVKFVTAQEAKILRWKP